MSTLGSDRRTTVPWPTCFPREDGERPPRLTVVLEPVPVLVQPAGAARERQPRRARAERDRRRVVQLQQGHVPGQVVDPEVVAHGELRLLLERQVYHELPGEPRCRAPTDASNELPEPKSSATRTIPPGPQERPDEFPLGFREVIGRADYRHASVAESSASSDNPIAAIVMSAPEISVLKLGTNLPVS